ncbi:uncharacterized protein TRUGW13939_02218 [Talaromyces rugulosus]|uniref:Uncharacterized protein n=1 Tax=Talaromyces rugulosus TaxID=121627 RepID=A0A7H8QMM8_TALRU|nr:uncharacterized protein TRUGW13939_02218 [Talaromyces rugulosus]QKX55126.1 hypothetical protein TRUGW13939_02218 [Talaromyces rugulosus]
MVDEVDENSSCHSKARACNDCVGIQTEMLVRKAYEKSSNLPDSRRKVIRSMLALAEKERVLRSSMVHLVAHFLAEYTKSYRDDSIEEWDRFEKSDQCRAMVKKHFSPSHTIPDEPSKKQGGVIPRGITRVMTSLSGVGFPSRSWANNKDDPSPSKKSSGEKANTFSGYYSSSSKPRI